MKNEFKIKDHKERENYFILEKEVTQWYQMEEVVQKYAYTDDDLNMIIFLTPMHNNRTKPLFEPLCLNNFIADM